MTGERSSQAQPIPVARLVAPGPSVAMASPGAPVMRPVTSAAKPAEPSCAVSTNSTPPLRIASISGSTLPLEAAAGYLKAPTARQRRVALGLVSTRPNLQRTKRCSDPEQLLEGSRGRGDRLRVGALLGLVLRG